MQFTGKTRTHISPLTGRLAIYTQALQNYVYDHQASPDLTALAADITTKVQAQGHDAYCDGVTLVQGTLTDTMQPSMWVASTQTSVGGQALLDPITIYAIVTIIKAVIPLFVAITAYYVITAVKSLIWGDPKQYYVPESGINEAVTWEQYISYQNAHYWYVSPKDGAGFGDKTKYPTIADVPQTEVQAYLDHCQSAPDISPQDTSFTTIAIIIGGTLIIVGGLWVVGQLFGRKR